MCKKTPVNRKVFITVWLKLQWLYLTIIELTLKIYHPVSLFHRSVTN